MFPNADEIVLHFYLLYRSENNINKRYNAINAKELKSRTTLCDISPIIFV